jgi:predicted nucleic acid-binding protein
VIVLDTNVLSEALHMRPAASVRRWMTQQPPGSLFTTSICEAEILLGVSLMPHGRRRDALDGAIAAIFEVELAGRILPFDREAARAFADISAARRRQGRPIPTIEAQIAAIARSRGAAVATRNVADFAECGIEIIDPWTA